MEKKKLGSFLAALRKANGMTQKDLADRLNVSDKAVSRWERDENCPDLTLIPVIADIFGVTSDELLRGERISSDSPANSARSEKQLQYMAKNLVFRYIVGVVIAVAVTIGGFIFRRTVAQSVGSVSVYSHGSDSVFSADIWDAVSVTIAFALWIAAMLYVILKYWQYSRELSAVEDPKTAEAPRKKLRRTFRIAIIFLAAFFILLCAAGETGSDFDMFFLLFLALFVGLNIVIPLILRAVNGIRRVILSDEVAKEEFRSRALRLTLAFLSLFGIVLFLGIRSNGSIFAPGKWFFREESFREYMETPTTDNWNPCAFGASLFGEPYIREYRGWYLVEDESGAEHKEDEWEMWSGEFDPDRAYRIREDSAEFRFRNSGVYQVLFFAKGSPLPIHTCTEIAFYVGWVIMGLLLVGIPTLYYLLLRRARKQSALPEPEDPEVREKIERYRNIVFPAVEDEAPGAATKEEIEAEDPQN